MSGHTAGPWVVVTRMSGSENHKGYRIAGDGFYFAEVMPLDEDGIKGGHNARLIAAAPMLLEIVTALLSAIDGENITNTTDEDATGVLADFARDAIAAATGEKS